MISPRDTVRNAVKQEIADRIASGTHRPTGIRYRYVRGDAQGARQGFLTACLNAVVMAHVDHELALAELQTLIAGQLPSGFIGDWNGWREGPVGSFKAWRERESGTAPTVPHGGRVQPPILAQVAERVAAIAHEPGALARLIEPLDRYYGWLVENRVFGRDGFLAMFAPAESGMPHSVAYDEALGVRGLGTRLRRTWRHRQIDGWNALANYDGPRMFRRAAFLVKDPTLNALFIDGLSTMARLHRRFGDSRVANEYEARGKSLTDAMVSNLWDEGRGAFFPLIGPEERRGTRLAVGGLIPLIVDGLPAGVRDGIVERHLKDRDTFLLRYPFATTAATDPDFDPRGGLIGRGPVSVFANWLLVRGLRKHDFNDVADQVAAQSAAMVAQAGLWECYSPLNGAGMGSQRYVGAGLVLDMEKTGSW